MSSNLINIVIRYSNHGTLQRLLQSLSIQSFQNYKVHIFFNNGNFMKDLLNVINYNEKVYLHMFYNRTIKTDIDVYNKGQIISNNDWILFLDERMHFSDSDSLMKISENMTNKYDLITFKINDIRGLCFNTTDIAKNLWDNKDSMDTVYDKLVKSNYFKNVHNVENICGISVSKIENKFVYKNLDEIIQEVHLEDNFYNKYLLDINEIPVYYINLDRSINRNSFMLKNISEINEQFSERNIILKATRIPAIDGNNPNEMYNLFTKNDITPFEINNNEIGCTLSHLFAIKKAYENNDNFAFIMEDDVNLSTFHKNYNILLEKLRYLSSDIEVIQALPFKEPNYGPSLYQNKLGFYKWKAYYYCSGLYIITRKGMKKMVEKYFENNKVKINNMNCFLADLLMYSSLNVITSNIPISMLTITKSTIRGRDDTNILKKTIVDIYNMNNRINN